MISDEKGKELLLDTLNCNMGSLDSAESFLWPFKDAAVLAHPVRHKKR